MPSSFVLRLSALVDPPGGRFGRPSRSTYNRPVRVQILTSVVGGGHRSVARALADALAELGRPELEFWVDDLYVDLARFPASRFPELYAAVTRRYPRIWRAIFRLTDRPPRGGWIELLGDQLGGPRLGRLLARRRPEAVVSTLPGVNGFVARSLAHNRLRPNLEVIVTDWADVHSSWVSGGVTHYTVPSQAAARTCRRAGVSAAAITVVGLPVRRQFSDASPTLEARRAARDGLGLPAERFVLLAMIGTEGSAGALAHLRALAQVPLDADIVVVCGRNQRLRRQVGGLTSPNRLRALGFVEEVAELMRAADLLVTKPGGVTLAEAFCCGVPVLAFDPLPGQEEANARFAVEHGAAELAATPRHLAELAAELRWSPPRRAELVRGGATLARPTAARDAAEAIVRRAERVAVSVAAGG